MENWWNIGSSWTVCSAYYAQPIPLTHFDTLNLILEFDETVENQFGQQSVSAMKQDKPWKGEYETYFQ